MKTATGYYINIFKENGWDVFVIINEANDEPNVEEISKIENIVIETLNRFTGNKKTEGTRMQEQSIREALEALELNCLAFGCQIIIRSTKVCFD